MERFLLSIFFLIIVLISAGFAHAQEEAFFEILPGITQESQTVSWGAGSVHITIPIDATNIPTAIHVRTAPWRDTPRQNFQHAGDLKLVSDVYEYELDDVEEADIVRPFEIRLKSPAHPHAQLYFFDETTAAWQGVVVRKNSQGEYTAQSARPRRVFALFESRPWMEGGQLHAARLPVLSALIVGTDDTIIAEKNANQPYPIASLTKLMTALVFLDHNPGWKKIITITSRDTTPPARLAVNPGERLTVRDLFESMLVGSRNNAARALAHSTRLPEKDFIKAMNAKARAFGMSHTVFVDTNGLDARNQASAQDYLVLARAAFTNPDIAQSLQKKKYIVRTLNTKRTITVKATNPFVGAVPGIFEGKTGYTEEAGYSFAAYLKQKDSHAIIILFGASDSKTRFTLAKEFMDLLMPTERIAAVKP